MQMCPDCGSVYDESEYTHCPYCYPSDDVGMEYSGGYEMRSERFPGIEWWCDRCGACLSTQLGFDDHKYTWKCTECGYKNSISRNNIFESYDEYKGKR